jgi:hypothetical protein
MKTQNTQSTEIAARLLTSDTWEMTDCKELCKLAGLESEWEAADGESFEAVVREAAEILGVEVE